MILHNNGLCMYQMKVDVGILRTLTGIVYVQLFTSKLRLVFHAVELKPASFANKKYSQGSKFQNWGELIQQLRCFDCSFI